MAHRVARCLNESRVEIVFCRGGWAFRARGGVKGRKFKPLSTLHGVVFDILYAGLQ
jgi:hypothetical protein